MGWQVPPWDHEESSASTAGPLLLANAVRKLCSPPRPRRTIPGRVRRRRSRRSRDAPPDGRTHSQDVNRSRSGFPPLRAETRRSRQIAPGFSGREIGSIGDPGALTAAFPVCLRTARRPASRTATTAALVQRSGATVPPFMRWVLRRGLRPKSTHLSFGWLRASRKSTVRGPGMDEVRASRP
jgi:hypothetical protein